MDQPVKLSGKPVVTSVGGTDQFCIIYGANTNTPSVRLIAASDIAPALASLLPDGLQTSAGLAGNIATLTANDTLYVGSVPADNVVSNAQLSANLAHYTNTAGLTAYQTTDGLAANVAALLAEVPTYADNASAASGGLPVGGVYQTPDGILHIVIVGA